MKKLRNLPEESFLRLLFAFFSLSFLVASLFMSDLSTLFSGWWNILTGTCKVTTNYWAVGGYAATFFNMGIVGLIALGLFCLPGAKPNNVSTLAFLLTVGFSTWGINPFNILPTILGVVLYCLVKKEKLGANANAMLFSTGIAPLISDLLFRYPNAEMVGFRWEGLLLSLIVGFIIGFFLPAGLGHSPKVHKGFDLYSAALPIGMVAFFLRAILYKVPGVAVPAAPSADGLAVISATVVNVFCLVVFGLCILAAIGMGCRPKDYWNLLHDSGHSVSFSQKYGTATMLMNLGVYGLFIVAYYNLIGAPLNGLTFGLIFCMVCCCNSGSHPGNVWPIMVGYVAASYLFQYLAGFVGGNFTFVINSQAIVIGLCFASGLSPIAGKYGWPFGIAAGALHYMLVTSVPDMHGGFCLYNGGFTAALLCILLVPQLERFFKTKEERKEKALQHK